MFFQCLIHVENSQQSDPRSNSRSTLERFHPVQHSHPQSIPHFSNKCHLTFLMLRGVSKLAISVSIKIVSPMLLCLPFSIKTIHPLNAHSSPMLLSLYFLIKRIHPPKARLRRRVHPQHCYAYPSQSEQFIFQWCASHFNLPRDIQCKSWTHFPLSLVTVSVLHFITIERGG